MVFCWVVLGTLEANYSLKIDQLKVHKSQKISDKAHSVPRTKVTLNWAIGKHHTHVRCVLRKAHLRHNI